MEASGPNAEQIRYWNEISGPKWVAFHDSLDEQNAPLGARVMDELRVSPGERVLDVGCGCGGTTLELARRVGPQGRATGADVSAQMLAFARRRATDAKITNVEFVEADAQTHAFTHGHDLVFSRYGVMFFADPVAAFTNLRRALASTGRLGFVCWQPLERNPWMAIPARAAANHVAMPPRPPPGTPGPFGLAERDRIERILAEAGYHDVSIDSIETSMLVGGHRTLDEAADFAMQFGPTAVALRDAPPDAAPRVREAVRKAIEPYVTSEGVRMDAALWFVRGRP
jgi:SAM-dependent methyltransferase